MTEPKWWDATISKKENTFEFVVAKLEALSERFVIGDEVGEGGYEHFQIRCVLKTGKSLDTLKKMDLGWHWSPTHVRDFNYCEKEGKFYRSWEGALKKYPMMDLLPWQTQAVGYLLDDIAKGDDRHITCIVDVDGNHGKTWLGRYLTATHQATYVPPFQEAQDFMAFAMAKPSKAYLIDMPRSESIKQRKGMWSAVEQMKNGYLYDKRYQFRDAWIEPPAILVFCNELPDVDSLSRDRWRFLRFDSWGSVETLEEYEPFDATA